MAARGAIDGSTHLGWPEDNLDNQPEARQSHGKLPLHFKIPIRYRIEMPWVNWGKQCECCEPGNFDITADRKKNFYNFANGGWKSKHEIPKEYSSWNNFVHLRDLNLQRLQDLLKELEQSKAKGEEDQSSTASSNATKLTTYYSTFMDEESIEALGFTPLKPMLDICMDAHADPTLTAATLLSEYGVKTLFSFYSSPDMKSSRDTLANISQSGLGLPDRDYYLDDDKAEIRAKYVIYIAKVLRVVSTELKLKSGCGADYTTVKGSMAAAQRVLHFETELASSHLSRTAMRDPENKYNKTTVQDLDNLSESKVTPLTWGSYLSSGSDMYNRRPLNVARFLSIIGKGQEFDVINVSGTQGVLKALQLGSSLASGATSGGCLEAYFFFHALKAYSNHLPKALGDAHFEFFQKELAGTTDRMPRWKQCLQELESAMGDALGDLYVTRYFSEEAKEKALYIVEIVRETLRERLGEVAWMGDITRKEAIAKMDAFKVKIGFPDEYLDYSNLSIIAGDTLGNAIRSKLFHLKLDMDRMDKPTDPKRWLMTPQTVNAYYHPLLNEIVFPAAILQAPFFDHTGDIAAAFGTFGAVVSHEMTHGFDDQGRKYDSAGNLRDWWQPEDAAEYERRAGKMIDQAERFTVHGVPLKGRLTAGENIADLGGLKLAYRAMQRALATGEGAELIAEEINGYNPKQRFFLAWASAWRQNAKKERELQLVTVDPHGPNEFRTNGPLKNMSEFHEAFNVTKGDDMWLDETDRVDIW